MSQGKNQPQLAGPANHELGGFKSQSLWNKVPEVTIFFWIIKVLATTIGETGADLLSEKLNLGLTYTSLIFSGVLLVVLLFQIRARKYVPSLYWLAVVMISVVGTLISDNLVDNLGVPLTLTTPLFATAMAVAFVSWYASEKTLSIHTIFTRRRELFYWLAILFTFALGTSGGDLLSEYLRWGYLNSTCIFAGAIGLVTLAYFIFRINAVLAFWMAYVLTRPLGASIGDLLSQPKALGGYNLGTVETSAMFLAIITGLVIYLTLTRIDTAASDVEPAVGPWQTEDLLAEAVPASVEEPPVADDE
ncbi:MAG: hypothetical protein HKL95_10655 [Phycisphaerae bacterium]|nr:hypothetical protein [Phycisphaerae bacterium]